MESTEDTVPMASQSGALDGLPALIPVPQYYTAIFPARAVSSAPPFVTGSSTSTSTFWPGDPSTANAHSRFIAQPLLPAWVVSARRSLADDSDTRIIPHLAGLGHCCPHRKIHGSLSAFLTGGECPKVRQSRRTDSSDGSWSAARDIICRRGKTAGRAQVDRTCERR